ncbi:hypothetical protein LTR08_007566 [Meristemomyces frigidus]|nr:hypothetical protein LTR08_007566 [Meristemomyces frigidus]
MATMKAKTAPIGSAQWIAGERETAAQLIAQEAEEFSYSVRNEFEWLNEHMADIFSTDQVNFADVFKTPGKLRGKTPRTARKRDALAPRQPLTDLFAPNAQMAPPAQHNAFYDKVAHFQIAEDAEHAPQQRPMGRGKSPQRVGKLGNTDSGYHGMTEDEMDMDARTEVATVSSQQSEVQQVPLKDDQARPQFLRQDTAGRPSDESFMSAKEDLSSQNASRLQLVEEGDDDNATVPDEEMRVDQPEVSETPAAELVVLEDEAEPTDQDMAGESPQSPSDASTPEKPLQRKSSFTFAALPSRDPLNTKHSMGGRTSQFDTGRNSVMGRSFGGKSMGLARDGDEDGDEDYDREKPEEAKVHSKISTQSLHERIKMLGKTKEPRTSKSIPQSVLGAQSLYPQLPVTDTATDLAPSAPEPSSEEDAESAAEAEDDDDDDDDWIAPSKPVQYKAFAQVTQQSQTPAGSPVRPAMHQKSISTTQISSPTRPIMGANHQKSQSVSVPNFANGASLVRSTTPAGTPMAKRHHDGPLSASKNKLLSAFRSAKGLFALTASTSAAAKLEARNHAAVPNRSPTRDIGDDLQTTGVYNMPGALYSHQQLLERNASVKSGSPSRKTRSSTESDKRKQKEGKAQQKAADQLDKLRDKEAQKAAKQQESMRKAEEAEAAKRAEKERKEAAERPVSSQSEEAREADMPPPPPPKSMLPAGKLRAPGRLVRPTREQPVPSKPAPVSIRVASQSQRLGQAPQSSMSSSQRGSMAPPPPPKTGLRTASAQGNVKSSTAPPNNARVKALEAAARKKEADERAALKKVEQKRELERKRAVKAEEERRVEDERKAAEQARLQDAKVAAQRKAEQQAVESRRREQQRLEQQRQQEEAQKARSAHELAEAIKRERAAQAPAHQRGDVGGTLRQLAKNSVPEQHARNNPAKPAKRNFQAEEDEPQHAPAPQRPGVQRGPPSYQQNDAKRRRTNEEQEERVERHSVMAPPKRPSNMRKESTLNKFPHGYTHAPPPATHHAASMFKATVTAQHQLQHPSSKSVAPNHPSQTVQLSNARIPFAENANPPAQHSSTYQPQTHHGIENTQPGGNSKFKTPGRPAQAPKSAKSSPLYPKGDNIELPEIQTDSEEDSDSDNEDNTGFRAPSWVASPALRDLLTQQQLVDPETVFGPIAELKMEEVFKGAGKNGERMKRFRDRGSSAAWVESGDAVTSAEKRRDMEVRERVVREGGWRYEPGV